MLAWAFCIFPGKYAYCIAARVVFILPGHFEYCPACWAVCKCVIYCRIAGKTGGTRRDLPLRVPLISFPGWDQGGPIYNENGPLLLLLDCFSAIPIVVWVVMGPLRHLGTLFPEGPQGLVPHLWNHFSSPVWRIQKGNFEGLKLDRRGYTLQSFTNKAEYSRDFVFLTLYRASDYI